MAEDLCLLRDSYWLLCGKEIGQGQNRIVYESEFLGDRVAKAEKYAQNFHNVLEWNLWKSVEHTDLARWFAPCYHISPNGKVLIMAKTRPANPADYPDAVPAFFTDLKRDNWGFFEDRLVCHDYALHLMLERGMTKRLRKVDWR